MAGLVSDRAVRGIFKSKSIHKDYIDRQWDVNYYQTVWLDQFDYE